MKWLTIMVMTCVAIWLFFMYIPAHGHDDSGVDYPALTKHTRCVCQTSPDERTCEPVKAISDPKTQTYYLPASGETLPASMALPSPDERFHRCTYPLNRRWATPGFAPAYPGAQYEMNAPMIERQGPGGWITVPDNSTKDGKPATLCFWAPNIGY